MAFAEPPGFYVISLRPQGQHGALRRAAARHGARLVALSPWRIEPVDDAAAREALAAAADASRVLFTSPAAVRAAARLQTLRGVPGQHWIAVGRGTAAALRKAGVDEVECPARMDSEGVLALPSLALPALGIPEGVEVGLVTAPEGRGLLASTLEGRGARVLRADVYRRVPVALPARTLARLRELDAPACLALTSEAALARVLSEVPADLATLLRSVPAVAASDRLRQRALELGMQRVERAQGPLPAQLLAAMLQRFR
jgi:uroporphyrinogen-III synthase